MSSLSSTLKLRINNVIYSVFFIIIYPLPLKKDHPMIGRLKVFHSVDTKNLIFSKKTNKDLKKNLLIASVLVVALGEVLISFFAQSVL